MLILKFELTLKIIYDNLSNTYTLPTFLLHYEFKDDTSKYMQWIVFFSYDAYKKDKVVCWIVEC